MPTKVKVCIFIFSTLFISSAFCLDIESVIEDYAKKSNPDWANAKIKATIETRSKVFEKYAENKKASFAISKSYGINKATPNMILPIAVIIDGREVEKTMVVARVEVFKDVVISREKINKKSKIDGSVLNLETKEVSLYPEKYFTDVECVSGKVAISAIYKGSIIMDWMIQDEPAVYKNSKIKIFVVGENVQIEANGISLADGQINDIIPVRRMDSKEKIDAKVISSDTVEVKL
ncbi:MAG: flagellar protein FlgA [Candidatus Saganbacteria bacterium]|uniref:Flagella basal body P-ring formation protein FlgA n=1 Tax=Candidatus Saganbacteria bacterium TaxID=2575572 RepID=A0A833L065_UNCSA|nr:MAG: flagellar protein FlgA [Candidatus Saganbacteria bacterium]